MQALTGILSGLVDLLAPRTCASCEIPLEPAEVGFCGGCGPLIEPATGGCAACLYGGPLAEAIVALKLRGRTDLVPALSPWLVEAALRHHAGRVDAVVPVPLHRRRLVARGFNQSALLARPVARALGVPLRTGCLRRVRDTPSQRGLGLAARRDNVRGAFAASRAPSRLLLIDDVRTTGATLAAAAAALRDAGTEEVRVLVLAQRT